MTASATGCDDGGEPAYDGQAACDEVATKLRGCELLSDGVVDCPLFEERRYGECAVECAGPASCEDMRAQTCDDADNEFARCIDRCEAVFVVFDCGDGAQIDAERRCDGEAECANGADEARCDPPETVDCGDGEPVSGSRCDGTMDCQNGADEADCPMRAMTLCAGGF